LQLLRCSYGVAAVALQLLRCSCCVAAVALQLLCVSAIAGQLSSGSYAPQLLHCSDCVAAIALQLLRRRGRVGAMLRLMEDDQHMSALRVQR
jgi:hypothetical protein